MALADLHLHTTASDGTWQPSELVEAAKQAGLAMIAITDHDTTAGVVEAQTEGKRHGLSVIAGVELSARNEREEIHLLGLGINCNDCELQKTMAEMRSGRVGRAKQMVGKLAALGVPVSYERVCALAGNAAIGRPHVARAMVEAGYVASVSAAFDLYLAEGRPAYVARPKVDPHSAIASIHHAGGVAVCAHPGLLQDDGVLPALVSAGLDGLEVYHSVHSSWQVARYQALAQQWGLLISGGSDCHGPGMHEPVLLGRTTISLALADMLLAACRRYR